MATNRDLLKEAIADAKSVKETAITNAKLALEEAFTPHLKSMLAAKLNEMDKEDDVVKEEEEEVKEADAPSFERKNSPAGDTLKDLSPRKVGQSTVQEDEVDEEIDLDELLAELEDSKEIDEAKKDDDKKDIKEDERTDAEQEGYEDGIEDEKEDMDDMEDEDIDLEDMSEDDLKGFIEDVIKDMVAGGEIEPGDEFVEDEVEVEDSIDIEDVEDVDVDIEIDETMKASEENSDKVKEAKVELDEMSKKEKAEGDDRKKDDKIEAETEKMRFKEALDEINALKVELNEVNLLNAKLLYTNKIFKAKNLTESKKVKVLKAFDNAKDVSHAKTIFETLQTGLIDKSINESRFKGSASKASGLEPKATSTKQPIIESNDVYNRMRKLAGLI
mgnify:CR=1 FL=1